MRRAVIVAVRLLVALAMPFFLALTAVQIIIADWYPRYEYNKTDFPADPYGFTTSERLERALVCIHFLNSPQPPEQAIAMLEALRLPGAPADKPLFTAAELSHMMDVKRFTDTLRRLYPLTALIAVGGLLLLLASAHTRPDGYAALFGGGLVTTGLLLLLGLFVLVGWRTFFIGFHEVFFPQGNWTFDWSDSLIRLFPDRFWFDAGVLLVGGTFLAGLGVLALGWGLSKRRRSNASSPA